MIASPQDYLQAAQRVVDAENRLRNQAQQLLQLMRCASAKPTNLFRLKKGIGRLF